MNPFNENRTAAGPHFVGREEELGLLDEALSAAGTGDSVGLMVPGVHGSGKSSFLGEAELRCLAQHLLPVRVQAIASMTNVAVVSSLLRKAAQGADAIPTSLTDSLVACLAPNQQGPAFQVPKADILTPDLVVEDLTLVQDFARTRGLRGMALLIDEAQYCDAELFQVIRYITHAMDGVAVLMAVRVPSAPYGALRAGEDWLRHTLGQALGDPGTERLFQDMAALGPFEEDEGLECIERRLSMPDVRVSFSDDLCRAVVSLSGRVPREIVRICRTIYQEALRKTRVHAGLSDLEPAYRKVHGGAIVAAERRISQLGESRERLLKEIVTSAGPVTVDSLARKLHPGLHRSNPEGAAEAVRSQVDALMMTCGSVQVLPDLRYAVTDEVGRAAVKLALRMRAF